MRWVDDAVAFIDEFSQWQPDFLAEEARIAAINHGIEIPADQRAWSVAMLRAKREKIIRSCGVDRSGSSGMVRTLWERA